jgi:NAD(P)-dependent dehydrogenase (short-subunit alcohol dehydrogenase family)
MSDKSPLVILCTGANRGIGFAIIQALANHPQTASSFLLLGCRDAEKGNEAMQELREKGITSSVEPLIIDVTSDVSIHDAVTVVKRQYGRLDVLVNNAGYAAVPSSALDHSDWREIYTRVYDTNVTSVALVTQHFLPLLRGSAGRVINISSARGSTSLASGKILPPTVSIPYSVSKAALNLLTVEMSRNPPMKTSSSS